MQRHIAALTAIIDLDSVGVDRLDLHAADDVLSARNENRAAVGQSKKRVTFAVSSGEDAQ
jgi:hypothetical protein